MKLIDNLLLFVVITAAIVLPDPQPDICRHQTKPPVRIPARPNPDHKPNLTVYGLIANSKATTEFTKLINRYPDLVELLNGSAFTYTVFAPVNEAFDKIPDNVKEPSPEAIRKMLEYHIVPLQFDAYSVFMARTIPTTLVEGALGGQPQRLRIGFGFGGLKINFYSKIISGNFFGSNGVVHAVDTLILPPPPASKIIELAPSEFSTLELALVKTGLDKFLAEPHLGGTLFAPTNAAFAKLGPKLNAFLFSKYGEKFLKSLIEYHIVVNKTMYSDAYFFNDEERYETVEEADAEPPNGPTFHVDLPTLLKNRSLRIDITRWGRLITIKINGSNTVAIPDGIAKDGFIHVRNNVLIPPMNPSEPPLVVEEMSVEEFKERLDGYAEYF